MFPTTLFILFTTATSVSGVAISSPQRRDSGVSITPHDKFSSSIGVLGCKINTNRVAYWPSYPSCDSICVKVSANGRSVNLLKIDQSGGAYDISYDAWNYLNCGEGAAESPTAGGGLAATYEDVDMSECADLITEPEGKLAFSAANSMNFVTSCAASSWIGQNFALYNIANSACTYGYDEICTMPDLSQSNQPSCPHQLGLQLPLSTCPVYNIDYSTGVQSLALWEDISEFILSAVWSITKNFKWINLTFATCSQWLAYIDNIIVCHRFNDLVNSIHDKSMAWWTANHLCEA